MLNNPAHNPPAIVFNVQKDTQSPAQSGPRFSTSFVNYVKKAENGVRSGFRGGKWYPIPDPNGKFKVIAYGHMVLPGQNYNNGITEAEAHALLMDDLFSAWYRADKWLKAKYGKGMAALPPQSQEALTDYAFNPGSLGMFPKFTDAVMKGDLDGMRREYKRSYTTASGQKKEMGRNELFYRMFLTGT